MAGMGGTERPAKLKKYGYQRGSTPAEEYRASHEAPATESAPEYETVSEKKEPAPGGKMKPKLGRARDVEIERIVTEASK